VVTRFARCPEDFPKLMELEENVFGADEHGTLGPDYVRLCCDFFDETCVIALDGERSVGYITSFIRAREAHCTTMAIVDEYQGTWVAALLIRAFLSAIVDRVDSCWFSVKEDNAAARALHRTLGAEEFDVRQNFYGPGDERIVSKIDQERFAKLRHRYERLGLVRRHPEPVKSIAT